MKHSLLIFCIVPMLLVAQVQKVAILETVDKQGDIPYVYKLMLRSNMAKAITNAPGYEAYDRTDMDAIMGEQDFQRTGMVSNDQIKRLGEMTGAAYILVAEAVKVDENNMFITAKILNVETAKTEVTENVLVEFTSGDIQYGCGMLANKLLGINLPIVKPVATPHYASGPSITTYQQQSQYETTIETNESLDDIKLEGMKMQLYFMDKSYSSACRKIGKKIYYTVFQETYYPIFKEEKKQGLKQKEAIEKAIKVALPKAIDASNKAVLECSGGI
jgi:hypothetical protein